MRWYEKAFFVAAFGCVISICSLGWLNPKDNTAYLDEDPPDISQLFVFEDSDIELRPIALGSDFMNSLEFVGGNADGIIWFTPCILGQLQDFGYLGNRYRVETLECGADAEGKP